MLNSMEYSKIFFITIHIFLHHGIMGRRLGATSTRTSNPKNSLIPTQEKFIANSFSEFRLYFNETSRLEPNRQTIAKGSHIFHRHNSTNGSIVLDEEKPSKPIYSNFQNGESLQGYELQKDIFDTYSENMDVDTVPTAQTIVDYSLIGPRPLTVNSADDNNVTTHSRGVRQLKNHRKGKVRLAEPEPLNFRSRSSHQCPRLAVRIGVTFTCTDNRRVGSICELSCPEGFVPNGKRTRHCEVRRHRKSKRHRKSSTRWTGRKDDFQCLPICKHFKNPENGDKWCNIVNTPVGRIRKCNTTCKKGYQIKGNPENICEKNGKWSSPPATCVEATSNNASIGEGSNGGSSIRHTKRKLFQFIKLQTLPCGESYGLTSFERGGFTYLVSGDKERGLIKIFRWIGEKFDERPFQIFPFPSPVAVEVVSSRDGTIWLIVGGQGPSVMYRMLPIGLFTRSHTITQVHVTGQETGRTDAIAFAELRGEFYRCYGRNRRHTPVIVVHKLQGKHTGGGEVFKRIMRKKLPGEKVRQCSMFTEGDSLYAVATLHRRDGRGRLMFGHIMKNRMKVVGAVEDPQLYQITDSHGFTINGNRYITVSQSVRNGQCIVYKRQWNPKPPEETG